MTLALRLPAVRRLRSSFSPLAALVALAGAPLAQGGNIPLAPIPMPIPGFNLITGGPGNTVLVGTDKADEMRDPSKGDADILVDGGIGGPDGVQDILVTFDGDDSDFMIGGPEDLFSGDPGDQVLVILSRSPDVTWRGRFDVYERGRAIFRWVQDEVQKRLQDDAGTTWSDVIADVQVALAAIEPGDGAVISFPNLFPLGPYEIGPVPLAPDDFLNWYRFDENDPVAATAQLTMSHEEFHAARAEIQLQLDYVESIGNVPLP